MIDEGIHVMGKIQDLPWYSTNWGEFGIMLLCWGLAFGILIGWGLHKNRDLIRKWIWG